MTAHTERTSTGRELDEAPERATALKLWVVLARAYDSVSRHSVADIGRQGLTQGEFGILEALYHRGPMLLGEVQRRILVSSGGITYLVDRLEKRGLVERRECPEDRRARYAALTEEGAALIERIFPDHAACIERAVSGLSPVERAAAIDLLRRLGRRAAELEPCPPPQAETGPG
jgi:MarR family transcriptional regulator, 2-MHQ and catechol-resistance regulon repressor